jgi:hypothetical protein
VAPFGMLWVLTSPQPRSSLRNSWCSFLQTGFIMFGPGSQYKYWDPRYPSSTQAGILEHGQDLNFVSFQTSCAVNLPAEVYSSRSWPQAFNCSESKPPESSSADRHTELTTMAAFTPILVSNHLASFIPLFTFTWCCFGAESQTLCARSLSS